MYHIKLGLFNMLFHLFLGAHMKYWMYLLMYIFLIILIKHMYLMSLVSKGTL